MKSGSWKTILPRSVKRYSRKNSENSRHGVRMHRHRTTSRRTDHGQIRMTPVNRGETRRMPVYVMRCNAHSSRVRNRNPMCRMILSSPVPLNRVNGDSAGTRNVNRHEGSDSHRHRKKAAVSGVPSRTDFRNRIANSLDVVPSAATSRTGPKDVPHSSRRGTTQHRRHGRHRRHSLLDSVDSHGRIVDHGQSYRSPLRDQIRKWR